MAQNLNYHEELLGKCYDNKDDNCEKYGRLYEWDDAIRVCPVGWYLPTSSEWNALRSFVGSDAGKLKSASTDWRDGAGTDDYGFEALPGGRLTNEFSDINVAGYWWTATEEMSHISYEVVIGRGISVDWPTRDNKTSQYSVRCVKGYSSSLSIAYGEVTDKRDNQKYRTVKIGTQNWMAQNLNYAGAYPQKCYCYNSKDANCEKYGRLYDWATAMDVSGDYNTSWLKDQFPVLGQHQGICPEGWHLPTSSEWNALKSFVGYNAGRRLKARSSEWNDNYGTDIYGFGALPGGRLTNEFSDINVAGYWWTATEEMSYISYEVVIGSGNGISVDWPTSNNKTRQYSVRCVED